MFWEHNFFDMEFVDRVEETARLKDVMTLKRPSLAVVYGRRRLAKSTWIKRVMNENDIYFLADKSEKNHQI